METTNARGREEVSPAVPQHGPGRSIALHLLPGAAITVFYAAAAPTVMAWGFPPLFALIISTPFVTIPILLGYLLHQARRRTGRCPFGPSSTLAGPIRPPHRTGSISLVCRPRRQRRGRAAGIELALETKWWPRARVFISKGSVR